MDPAFVSLRSWRFREQALQATACSTRPLRGQESRWKQPNTVGISVPAETILVLSSQCPAMLHNAPRWQVRRGPPPAPAAEPAAKEPCPWSGRSKCAAVPTPRSKYKIVEIQGICLMWIGISPLGPALPKALNTSTSFYQAIEAHSCSGCETFDVKMARPSTVWLCLGLHAFTAVRLMGCGASGGLLKPTMPAASGPTSALAEAAAVRGCAGCWRAAAACIAAVSCSRMRLESASYPPRRMQSSWVRRRQRFFYAMLTNRRQHQTRRSGNSNALDLLQIVLFSWPPLEEHSGLCTEWGTLASGMAATCSARSILRLRSSSASRLASSVLALSSSSLAAASSW